MPKEKKTEFAADEAFSLSTTTGLWWVLIIIIIIIINIIEKPLLFEKRHSIVPLWNYLRESRIPIKVLLDIFIMELMLMWLTQISWRHVILESSWYSAHEHLPNLSK